MLLRHKNFKISDRHTSPITRIIYAKTVVLTKL